MKKTVRVTMATDVVPDGIELSKLIEQLQCLEDTVNFTNLHLEFVDRPDGYDFPRFDLMGDRSETDEEEALREKEELENRLQEFYSKRELLMTKMEDMKAEVQEIGQAILRAKVAFYVERGMTREDAWKKVNKESN